MLWRLPIWLTLSSLVCLASPAQEQLREWTSDTGTTVNATLVGSETVTVYVLRKDDGTEIRVPANRLSPASRTLAENLIKARSADAAARRDTTAKDDAAKAPATQPADDDVKNDVAGKGAIVEKIQLPAPTTFSGLGQPVKSLTFSPTGSHLFVAFFGGKGRLWHSLNWEEIDAESPDCNYFGYPAVFSPDGEFLACCDGELIRVWSLRTSPAKIVNTAQGSRKFAQSGGQRFDHQMSLVPLYVWAENGTLVALGNDGLQCFNYDAARGAIPFATVTGQTSVDSLKTFQGGRIDCGQLLNEVIGRLDSVVSPKGNLFVAAVRREFRRPEGVFLWEIPTSKFVDILEVGTTEQGQSWYSRGFVMSPHGWHGRGLVMSPDGTRVGASRESSNEKIVSLWRLLSPTKRIDLSGKEVNPDKIGTITDFCVRCFSPDGSRVATSSRIDIATAAGRKTKWVVALWDTTSGNRLLQFDASGTENVLFTRDGKTLVVGGGGVDVESQVVQFRDVQTGDVRFQVTDNGISTLALSPDEKLLVTGYHKQALIRAWEVK